MATVTSESAGKAPAGRKPARDYGRGTVYRRGDGMWVGSYEAGETLGGKRRRITASAKTAKLCQDKLDDKILAYKRDGAPADAMDSRSTVKTYALYWLGLKAKTLRPSTYRTYKAQVERWIVPEVGKRRLDRLTPADIRSVHDAITDAGHTTTTALHAHRVIIAMLKDAKRDGHGVPERVMLTKGPRKAVHDRGALTVEQCIAIANTIAGDADRSRCLTALLAGMRQAECLGLTWDRVDLDAGSIDVSWQLQEIPWAHGCGGTCGRKATRVCPQRKAAVPDGYEYRQLDGATCLTRPKTARGQRIIPLVSMLDGPLRDWQDTAPPSPHGLVWPDDDGAPRHARADGEQWRSIQDRAGIRHPSGRYFSTHEIRHSTASLLNALGVDAITMQAILGHSSFASSRAYLHADQTMARKALEGVAALLMPKAITPGTA